MTTAAQRLVALSGLGSATALQHLLAMQGDDAGKTIFCSQMTAVIEHEAVTVSRKTAPPSVGQPIKAPQTKINAAQKAAFSFKPKEASFFSFTGSNEIVALRQKSPVLTVMKMDQAVVINKHPNL